MAQAQDLNKRESEVINIALETYYKVLVRKHNSEPNHEIKELIAKQVHEVKALQNKTFQTK